MGWWAEFRDAISDATVRAAVAGRRYRVRKDRASGRWNVIETTKYLDRDYWEWRE